MKVLGIIPARAGSVRLPGKNWRELDGKPLIEWTLEAADNARGLDGFCVSTDAEDVERICTDWGVAFHNRPPHLASDTASSYDVIMDVLGFYPDGYTHFCLLQPTSPFRIATDIDHCIDLCRYLDMKEQESAVVSVDRNYPDQPNGAVYVASFYWLQTALDKGFTYPFDLPHVTRYRMPTERSLDIDTQRDWSAAEAYIAKRLWSDH